MNQLKSREPGSVTLPGTLSAPLRAELIAFRRDLHMHPELGNQEFRTTAALKARLEAAGLVPKVLPGGTGLICDIGTPDRRRPMLAIRADLDALPIPDVKTVAYRSTVANRAHACGHDVHTTTVLGAGLVLAELDRQGLLPYAVRLLFQPAEEVLPGGAADAVEAGVLDGVGRIIAVHCDPRVDAGKIGLRPGPITSACDRLEVTLDGPGGHTARPHLTTDLVTAAARIATDVPAVLARRVDARSGLSVTWGRIEALPRLQRHPAARRALRHRPLPRPADLAGGARPGPRGDRRDRGPAPREVHRELRAGRPPVVNDGVVTELLADAMTARRGPYAIEDTEQSLGGEDFSWYLEHVPGAMARLGVRTPGDTRVRDLHAGDFDVDERCIETAVELFTAAALLDRRG